MDDIAARVGYPNGAAFIRCYKRYEGITPGVFRSLGLGGAK